MENKTESIKEVLVVLSKILELPKTRLWIKYTLIKFIGREFIEKPYSYQMVDLGFKREWIVQYESIVIPMILIGTSFSILFLKKGKINYYYWNVTLLLAPAL